MSASPSGALPMSETVSASRLRHALPARPNAVGLQFDSFIPFEEWRSLGKRLGARASASAWWIGDWICFGRATYGRQYSSALIVTGLDYQTLRNYASVARRFELCRRRYKLTFQHHAVVRALTDDEQDHWLTLAEENRWSRNELRRAIRASKRTDSGDDPPSAGIRIPLTISLPPAPLARWRAEAERAGLKLEAWIVAAVERSLSAGGPVTARSSEAGALPDSRRRSGRSGQRSAMAGSRRRSVRRGGPEGGLTRSSMAARKEQR
jgi:hypothetical protein